MNENSDKSAVIEFHIVQLTVINKFLKSIYKDWDMTRVGFFHTFTVKWYCDI